MANKIATLTFSLAYTGPSGEALSRAQALASAIYQAEAVSLIDIPDAEAAATAHEVPFGSIDEGATFLMLKNNSGQELELHLNGSPPSVAGTLVAGTKTVAFAASATGNLRVVAGASNGGTPGVLSVRKSGGNVIVESWLAGTGIEALDVSDFTVYDDGDVVPNLPNGALVIVSMPAQPPAAGSLTSVSLVTTGLQAGAGTVEARVFGDPT